MRFSLNDLSLDDDDDDDDAQALQLSSAPRSSPIVNMSSVEGGIRQKKKVP